MDMSYLIGFFGGIGFISFALLILKWYYDYKDEIITVTFSGPVYNRGDICEWMDGVRFKILRGPKRIGNVYQYKARRIK